VRLKNASLSGNDCSNIVLLLINEEADSKVIFQNLDLRKSVLISDIRVLFLKYNDF
jgi:hypothetical protein